MPALTLNPSPTDADTALPFSPPPSSLPQLFRDLADPYQSLDDVSRNHDTSLESLSAWIARPDVQDHIARIGAAAATRSRLCAANVLPRAVNALLAICDGHTELYDRVSAAPTPQAFELRRRHADTAHRAHPRAHVHACAERPSCHCPLPTARCPASCSSHCPLPIAHYPDSQRPNSQRTRPLQQSAGKTPVTPRRILLAPSPHPLTHFQIHVGSFPGTGRHGRSSRARPRQGPRRPSLKEPAMATSFLAASAGSRRSLCAIAFAALIPCSLARAQTFNGIGTLAGDDDSLAFGVSADGSIVVGATGSRGFYHNAIRWTLADGVVNIAPGAYFGFAHAISADGSAIVGIGDPDGSGNSAFRWTSGDGMVRLDTPVGWGYSDAYAITADGSVVSGYSNGPGGKRAVRWNNAGSAGGTMQDLGTLSTGCGGSTFSQGYGGISADGSAISGDSSADVQYCSGHVFRWTSDGNGGGTMQDLGHLPGIYPTDSLAFGLSADGAVVVGSSQTDNADQAFRWTSGGGMVDIGSLLTAGNNPSQANAANADGTAVVGSYYNPDAGDWHAFLWNTVLGAVDLQDYLTSLGIDLTGWVLQYGNAVSADGRTIVGYGLHGASTEGWIATLCLADYDQNSFVNGDDFDEFSLDFYYGNPAADVNHDGFVNGDDFDVFSAHFDAGC